VRGVLQALQPARQGDDVGVQQHHVAARIGGLQAAVGVGRKAGV
jgi:hypothetical protein